MSELKQTDLSKRLRDLVTEADRNPAIAPLSAVLGQAADEIDCYYTDMLNWKATAEAQSIQPEATKPAQDLGAAILALPEDEILQAFANAVGNERDGAKSCYVTTEEVVAFVKYHLAPLVSASPADALVAGDRVDVITDTYRMDFQQANPHMYFNVDKRGKCWRFGYFSNYPQDCYGSAREAIDAAIQAQKDGHG